MAQPITLEPPPEPSKFERMCCNIYPYPGCQKLAVDIYCDECNLVAYCSDKCRKEHDHKKDCYIHVNGRWDRPLAAANWRPDYRMEGRAVHMPGTAQYRPAPVSGGETFLWGDTPAFDLLKLGENEGKEYQGDLNLYFAASSDLRNVIMTLANLPDGYSSHVNCVVNDLDENVSIKNGLLMRYLFCQDDEVKAAEGVLHLWYSAHIGTILLREIQKRLSASIPSETSELGMFQLKRVFACDSKDSRLAVTVGRNIYNGRTMSHGENSTAGENICSAYPGATGQGPTAGYWKWPEIEIPENNAKAEDSRGIAHEGPLWDALQMSYELRFNPKQRLSEMYFRYDGRLQPFGARYPASLTNPTLFDRNYKWMPNLLKSPMSGWPLKSVLASGAHHHVPKNDIYGAMYFHLRDLLIKFHRSIRKHSIDIFVTNANAAKRPTYFSTTIGKEGSGPCLLFDRIDTSDIADECWLGIDKCLSLGQFLKPDNPHATLVTLFTRAVQDTDTPLQDAPNDALRFRPELRNILMPECINVAEAGNPEFIERQARFLFRDLDAIFALYGKKHDFKGLANKHGMEEKQENSIIEKFPFRPLITDSAVELEEKRFHDSPGGPERYVEWKRAVGGVDIKEDVEDDGARPISRRKRIFMGGEKRPSQVPKKRARRP